MEDIVGVDIYNRFDKYYREKICVNLDAHFLSNESSPSHRLNSVSLKETKHNFHKSGENSTLGLFPKEKLTTETLPSVVDVEIWERSGRHLKEDNFTIERHLSYPKSRNMRATMSCCEFDPSEQGILSTTSDLLSRGICQACDLKIEGHSEHLLIYQICEHRFHYSCLEAKHESHKHSSGSNPKLMMCPKCTNSKF